jgi:hypothetical protein
LPLRTEAIEHFSTRLVQNGAALQIDPRCKHLIRALNGGWRYPVKKKDTESYEPEKNRHSHPGDAFGYLCRYFHATTAREARRAERSTRQPPMANPYVMR